MNLNNLFIVFLLVVLSSCSRTESKNGISNLAYDPTQPNIVWRVMQANNTTEEFDIISKKVLRKLPKSLENSYLTDILITPKYVIHCYIPNFPDNAGNIFVYKKDDLSLFCTNKDIGKLTGEPNMKIASAMYASGTFMNENHFITIQNDRNVTKYFDFHNDKTLSKSDLTVLNQFISLSTAKYRDLFSSNSQNDNKLQQFFSSQSFIQHNDYEVFTYKENALNDAETFIGMIGDKEGFMWKIPVKSLIKNNVNITKENLRKSRIIGNILYLQLDYKVGYKRSSDRRGSSDNISTVCTIDKITGKINWIYDTYELSTAKLVKDEQEK